MVIHDADAILKILSVGELGVRRAKNSGWMGERVDDLGSGYKWLRGFLTTIRNLREQIFCH